MKQKLSDDIRAASEELIALLASFTEERLNTVPFEGSWTAGQVADHIYKSLSGSLQVINGNVSPAQRPIDAKSIPLSDMFLDFTTRMQSPTEILPTDAPLKKNAVVLSLENILLDLHMIAEKRYLALICLDFEFPTIGLLTRYEWLCFTLYHTQRHIHQLKKISQHFHMSTAA